MSEDLPRTTRKRKRDLSKELTPVSIHTLSPTLQDTLSKPEGIKKIKLTIAPPPISVTPKDEHLNVPGSSSPVKTTVVTRTERVPLAPEGPSSSPKSNSSARRQLTPRANSIPLLESRKVSAPTVQPTAAQSRPRRTSGSQKPTSPTEPTARTAAIMESEKRVSRLSPPRQRSRDSNAARSMKAASAEPSYKNQPRDLRGLRRASVVEAHPASDPATAAPSIAEQGEARVTRARRRPAPGLPTDLGDANGNVILGKRRVAPKKKGAVRKDDKKENEEPAAEETEDVDPNEERYCVCNDVSWGVMIACEAQSCEKEWFHLPCVGLQEIPPRRSKWYCEDCRKSLMIDEKGRATAVPTATAETRSGRR